MRILKDCHSMFHTIWHTHIHACTMHIHTYAHAHTNFCIILVLIPFGIQNENEFCDQIRNLKLF